MADLQMSHPASAFHRRGLAHAQRRQLDHAIQDFAHAIQIDPQFALAYIDRGVAHAQRGDFRQALADLNQGLALAPHQPVALLARGMVHVELGAVEAALRDLTAAREASPQDADICYQRGKLHLVRGDYAAAIADFSDAANLHPPKARHHNQLAWLWSTHKDPRFRDGPKALDHAGKACDLTEWKDAVVLDTLAAACAECGQYAEAVRWAEKALALAAPHLQPLIRGRLGLYRSGQPFREIGP